MITSLRLERFGAFRDRELSFAAVTLFVGPNESGKTTIVDALCEVLCRPRSNRIAGRRLALRYGADRLASAEFDGEPMTIPEDAFGDLFAIRSGDLTLDVRPGAGWVEALKADLFTAGLDPRRLHAALARRAGTDGGSRHIRELRQLREEQRRLEQRREALREQAVAARSAKAAVAERQAERGRLADELDALTRTLDARQRRARQRLQQAERREAERLLRRFEEFSRDDDRVAAAAGVAVTAGTAAVAALIRLRAAEVEAIREETDRAAERLRVRRERHHRAERELRDFLARHGAESPEQLLMQLGGARADEARRRDVESELLAAARERGVNDLDALADALREQLRAVEPIPSPAPAAEGHASADEEALRARVAGLRERLDELDERVGRDREKAAALNAGAAEMAELTPRIAAGGRRIAALELDRRAAGVAASVFARIADESTAALDELARDIGARYAAVSGSAGGHSSAVSLAALEEEPLIVDAAGVARPAGRLSQGTRDAYSLAARLALAERAQLVRGGGAPGLLVLDEPFQAMDATRMRSALRLIARFQERTGWQLVVLTADERVALAVSEQFAGAQVHRLAVRESGN